MAAETEGLYLAARAMVCFARRQIFRDLLHYAQCSLGLFHQNRQLLRDIAALAASVINRWVQAYYGVVPLILVIPHTFGRRLNFHPHLHILVSAGGLNKRENRWVNFRYFDNICSHVLVALCGEQVLG